MPAAFRSKRQSGSCIADAMRASWVRTLSRRARHAVPSQPCAFTKPDFVPHFRGLAGGYASGDYREAARPGQLRQKSQRRVFRVDLEVCRMLKVGRQSDPLRPRTGAGRGGAASLSSARVADGHRGWPGPALATGRQSTASGQGISR